ncbi:hypothetical protein SteCoe_35510 [Stentor coeruleus]|uniref:Major facilitator superfamily (MFS) profile domain-containing protein n=1 Tax=Stentor coeruleus TaxID=5963 RepID=A0A1R2AS55_9CILI|nr:hypothetical protein SteCoe_35510 [Stentor coeruleus]
MEKNYAYSVLELIGWGKFNAMIFVQCGLSWSTFEIWFVNMGFVIEGTKEEWNLDTFTAGIVGSFMQVGLMLGSLFWGYIGNTYGRVKAFKTTAIIASAASVLLTFAPDPYVVGAGLFAMGFGLAGEISLGGTVFYEYCPPSKRYYMTLMSAFLSFGAITVTTIALLVSLYNTTGYHNWRVIVAIGSVIEIISMFFRFFMHETPAFLITQNKQSAADKILNIVSLKNTGKELSQVDHCSASLNPNELTQEILAHKEDKISTKGALKRLFTKPLLKTTIILGLVYMITHYSFSGFLYFMPEFLSEFSTSTAYAIILIQQLCGIPGVILGTYLVETRLGRRLTTNIFNILSGVAVIVFCFGDSFWFVVIVSGIIFMLVFLALSSMFTLGPESFPTSVRSTGLSLAMVCARFGGILSPIITGYLLEITNGFYISLALFCGAYIVSGFLVLLLEETKGKKIG